MNSQLIRSTQFQRRAARPQPGFTLIELLVVIAIIGVLASMLLPALATAKAKSQAAMCTSNNKQLQLAWTLYSADFNDDIVSNSNNAGLASTNATWCPGWMKLPTNDGSATNNAFFMNGLLGRYAGAPGIFKCPTDKYIEPGRTLPYPRSVSMNIWMNFPGNNIFGSVYSPYRRTTEINKASDVFAFIHESPNSIEDCVYRLDLPGGAATFENSPAALHNGGTTMAFIDGHTEMRKWGQLNQNNGWPIPVGNATDVKWLKDRAREQ